MQCYGSLVFVNFVPLPWVRDVHHTKVSLLFPPPVYSNYTVALTLYNVFLASRRTIPVQEIPLCKQLWRQRL